MNDLQRLASNPNYSVWVSASAGTGKTKILTDRVLRLLINGSAFNKILCLTFTNAAATEMHSRITARLAEWATSDPNKLKYDLGNLLGLDPSDAQVNYARTIYNKLLNTQDKISINTIHSFCLKILKRFPLESDINPSFQVLDNIKEREIITKIKQQIYLDKENEPLINFFIANFHEITLNDIFEEIIQQKLKFKKLFSLQGFSVNSSYIDNTSKTYIDIKEKFAKVWQSFSSVKDQYEHIWENTLYSFFLTKDGKKRQRLLLNEKKLANKYPELLNELNIIQEQIYQFEQTKKIDEMFQCSNLLSNLAKVFIDKYEAYKKEYSLLDYDDLIYLTKSLLTKAYAKDWVLYKLDGGIDHLLVDEAQDTSPEQWEIIMALIEEFYSGDGSNDLNRTIFVVGDEKQSIFSFQGANIKLFNLINNKLTRKLINANKDLKVINLEVSYRSFATILTVVYDIFQQIKASTHDLFTADNIKIQPFRKTHSGRVELWPLIKPQKTSQLFWPLPFEHDYINPPERQLAIQIAKFIKKQIDDKVIIPSTGLAAKCADFMILVRTRDKLIVEVINQLKIYELDVTGIDRMILNQNLSVMDLICAAKFVLEPNDDLNLACLLKSPIIGLLDDGLRHLALLCPDGPIWELLNDLVKDNLLEEEEQYIQALKILKLLLDIYKNSNAGNFFHILVDRLDLRTVLIKFNGSDSNDAINELLYLSSNYANKINSSLQNFIYWFESNNIEVKRDVELSDKIQVMTVHASKGLQAPVVILCDTTSIPINRDKFTWTNDGNPILTIQSAHGPQLLKDLKSEEQKKDLKEYLRLLYVAITRPSDYLVVCGYHAKDALPLNCWYDLIHRSMIKLGKVNSDGIMIYGDCNFQTAKNQNLRGTEKSTALFDNNNLAKYQPQNINYYIHAPFIINKNEAKNKGERISPVSPFISRNYLKYGRVFHKVLEDTLKTKDLSKLSSHPLIQTMPPELQNKIYKSIKNLLKNEDFIDLLNHEIKIEVNIGINQDNLVKIGRIDLLIITKQQLTIIDYKSDAVPPAEKSVPAAYIDQLNFYRQIIQKLYPNCKIICKILWLENGNFMAIL